MTTTDEHLLKQASLALGAGFAVLGIHGLVALDGEHRDTLKMMLETIDAINDRFADAQKPVQADES